MARRMCMWLHSMCVNTIHSMTTQATVNDELDMKNLITTKTAMLIRYGDAP